VNDVCALPLSLPDLPDNLRPISMHIRTDSELAGCDFDYSLFGHVLSCLLN
jgi:hypothetical protein